ncbi:hypothetical protein PSTG_16816 [Puccinia striiformis f. sp. tritici PST-78]|uniref:No apical meristem-associated C-terminal domain-containing protein n=1 Tax=Puccinia striiformis f. sp. tritici PST-78 TaxID=1165861 RepID=A0A0L0URL7_9BASI|nr:hypothetical protein PSTG_16816 [Puccinia striiformis f. sp. tritici PST-78]
MFFFLLFSGAAASQPLGIEVGDDDKPAPQPAKKARKPTKKPSKAAVTPKPDDHMDKNDEAPSVDVDDLKKTTGSRSGNYITEEDVQICLSWLETTKDPLNSTNQSGTTFWDRVHGHYLEQVPQYPRSADSVKSRFGIIQQLTTKFHGCVKQIILANQSGKTVGDRIPAALKLYIALKKDKGKDYTHMQCYHILSNAQKWLDYCDQLEHKRLADLKKNELSSDNPQSDLASDTTTTAVPSMRSDDTYRPTGNKKAKDARAQEAKDTKWKDDLIKVNRDLANHSESQSAILAEQKDALVAMSDESTMLIDLNSIPESKREFFEWRQHKVIEKMKKAKADEAQKKKEDEEKKTKEAEEKKKKEEEKKEEEEIEKKEDEAIEKEVTQKKILATSKKHTAVKKKAITAKSVPKKAVKDTKAAAEAKRKEAEAKKKEEDEAVRRIVKELSREEELEEGGEEQEEEDGEGEEEEEDIDID